MDSFNVFETSQETPPSPDELQARLMQATGANNLRTLAEADSDPALRQFLKREFPRQAAIYQTSINRRAFLKLIGASLALAGLAACSPPEGETQIQYVPPQPGKYAPYVNQPERILAGIPLYYATAVTHGGYATGLLVRSELGRPIKIEGNPNHPASLGATDIFAQASILTLYDPDRSRTVLQNGKADTWDNFLGGLRGSVSSGTLRILTPPITSPTLAAQLHDLLGKFSNARWHQYEPFSRDNARAGSQLAFGEYVETRYDLTRVNVVLSLDSDFLNAGPGNLRYARDFAARRHLQDGQAALNRLYAIESTPTLTGAQADHRLAMRASEIVKVTGAIAAVLGVSRAAGNVPASVPQNWIDALSRDLQAQRGASVIIAGDRQPPYVHALAHALNQALGNVGTTVFYSDSVEANPINQTESLRRLVNDMNAGSVQSLLILDGNPVFDAPVDFQFGEALKKVAWSAHLSSYEDETSAMTTWHIPAAHYLEAWGDARAYDGTVSIVQPLIAPLYEGCKSAAEILSAALDTTPRRSADIVKAYWQTQAGTTFDEFWRAALSAGFVADSAFVPRAVTLKTDWVSGALQPQPLQSYEVVFAPDPTIHDGTFGNNAWLQELPKPFTKVTWDNVLAVSPATAQQIGLNTEIGITGGEHGQVEVDVVEVKYQGRTLRAPVWILSGHPDDMVTVYAGYGRTHAGGVGNGAGYNAYALRTSNAMSFGNGLDMTKTGERVSLATTQFHTSMEGRDLVQATTIQAFAQDPNVIHHNEPKDSLYPPPNMTGEQWGMAIDLNACIGCNACVVACQAENNIPTVGKDQVMAAREMHWLRVDRYEQGQGNALQVLHEPVPCMHCEYAPCEVVCPVEATTHSPDGLNEMTYNRCVGTRYCSNNCPYKVRRFNFFQYTDWQTESLKPLRNPDVTVRSRGVMEKCTYCVQRINRARIGADKQGRGLRDGEVITACQAVCPTQAIVFGNIADPNSRVAQMKAQMRNYALLAELNTRPRTTYLAVVRNPNPEL